MIYVLKYPTRWIDKLWYQLRGVPPLESGDEILYGPGGVEIVDTKADSCAIVPYPQVMRIVFTDGYAEAVKRVQAHRKNNIADQFNDLLPNVTDIRTGAEAPYNSSAVEPLKDIRDFQ
jgi:hypothetical protein